MDSLTSTIGGLGGGSGGLSSTLHSQFIDWEQARKPQEEELLRAYQDNMRIWRDDDSKDSGTSKAQKSRVFVGSTRGKIRSARAKIKDSLFGTGVLPFDTKPSKEELKDYSDCIEAILKYQLEEEDWKTTLGTGVDALATYGTGFMFGPFVKSKSHASVEAETGAMAAIKRAMGRSAIKETRTAYDCPYYEHAPTMDVYPDPEAENELDGRGIYWASRKSPEFLKSLKGQDGYSDEAIDLAVTQTIPGTTSEGTDRARDSRMNLYRYTKEGRVWFVRYFGLIKKRELSNWKKSALSDSADDEMVEAIAILAGGHVIKAEENPYKDKRRPVRRCVYEAVEHEMWGVGVAKNNDPNQRVINAAFRLFIEGKAYALLKMCSIDRSKFEVAEDFKFFPGKRFMMRQGLSPDERKEAIIWHDTLDVTQGWESVIELSERFSDDDTAITKYTQGNDSKSLNDTATGISMIMNAASLPMKEVLSNIDEMWIEKMIEGLIDWDMENLEPETVKALIGDKEAQCWSEIKQYGKTNFMEWFATGSKTFMAKEVLMNKMNGFLQLVSSNPVLANLVDMRELLDQVWQAGQIGSESPVYDEETLKNNQAQGPQNEAHQAAQQAIEEVKKQAQVAIKQAQDETTKAQQQADQAKQQEQYRMADLQSREKAAERQHELAKMAILERIKDAGIETHKTEAEIDLIQAQTVNQLAQAGKTANPDLEEAAESKEGDESKPDPVAAVSKMHADLMAKHGDVLDAVKRLAGPRKRTMSVENGKKTVIDMPMES